MMMVTTSGDGGSHDDDEYQLKMVSLEERGRGGKGKVGDDDGDGACCDER